MTALFPDFTTDGHRVRRLDNHDVDALAVAVIDGYALPRQSMQALITWCRWLYAMRGRAVIEAMHLHADGQISTFALQQLAHAIDWSPEDTDYMASARRDNHAPMFWGRVP